MEQGHKPKKKKRDGRKAQKEGRTQIMGYLSCKADSSIATCRSLSAVAHAGGTFSSLASPYHRHRRKKDPSTRSGAGDGGDIDADAKPAEGQGLPQFSYKVLEEATGNFSDEALLGRGSHGSVYKAILPSGRVVAVKRPSRVRPRQVRVPATPAKAGGAGAGAGESTSTTTNSTDSSCRVLGRSEIQNEMEVLSRIQGCPRIVNVVGVSCGGSLDPGSGSDSGAGLGFSSFRKPEERALNLLVMEYMPNGTLFDLLHSNPRPPGWSRRLRLALQTAKAVHALHSHKPTVIHRDVKSANVLLDHGLNARLGDFGLAVFCPQNDDEQQHHQQLNSMFFSPSSSFRSTPPAGTLGYLDPGYVTPDSLSTKTDVFSFGILLLEIMSGRKAFDVAHSPPSIVEWAIPLMRMGKVLTLFDPRIAPPADPFARRQLAALAASCVRSSRDRRPSMDQVIERLKTLRKAISSKVMAWNGFYVSNPCSAIDTQNAYHSRLKNRLSSQRLPKDNSSDAAASSRDTSPRTKVEVEVELEVEESAIDPAITVSLPRVVPFQTPRIPRRVPSSSLSSSSNRCHHNLVDLIKSTSLEEETVPVRTPSNIKLANSLISQLMVVKPEQTSDSHDKEDSSPTDLSIKGTVDTVSATDKKGGALSDITPGVQVVKPP